MDTREELIVAVREVAARRGVRSLPLTTFLHESGLSVGRVYGAFESWPALCEAAGLVPNHRNRRMSAEMIFLDMRDAFLARGGLCSKDQFLSEVPYSISVLRRRFTSWKGALAAFRRWAVTNAPGFPYMAALDKRLGLLPGMPPPEPAPPAPPSWPSHGGRLCGDPLGFRALMFAPVNEQGVVLLFGMVAAELGYTVETVATGFPDCTARRRVASGR